MRGLSIPSVTTVRRTVLSGLTVVTFASVAAVGQDVPESVEYCLGCHDDESMTMELEDGEEMSLNVPAAALASSVHGEELVCTDCHEGYEDDSVHPAGATFESARAYAVSRYEVCRSCHFDTYTKTLESIHYELLEKGSDRVPVCTDCHGAHAISDPHQMETMISRSCKKCHEDVFDVYAKSVHGAALMQEGIQAVPGCPDCHTAHSIQDPNTASFRISSPEICIECHGNDQLMAEFDLPTTVADTYLADFHGVTATLADPAEVEQRQLVVTCVDCHGFHDIAAPSALPAGAMQERVRQVCTECHEGAGPTFQAAWLSHYPPSLKHAPLVYLVNLFYAFFIPFVVLGLALQIGLHLYRVAARR